MLAFAGRAGRWLAISLGVFVLLFLILLAAGTLVESKLAGYVSRELEKHIAARLSIQSFDVSLLRKLPYATFALHGVTVYAYDAVEGRSTPDTLLYATDVYLHFNLVRLLRKEIELNHLTIREGFIRPTISRKGRTNYEIFRLSTGKNELRTSLRDVKIQDFEADYSNQFKNFSIRGICRALKMHGQFTEDQFEVGVEAKTSLLSASAKGRQLIYPMNPKVEFIIKKEGKNFLISQSAIEINKQRITLDGTFTSGSPAKVDLQFDAPDLDILESLRLAGRVMPDSLAQRLATKGNLAISGKIKGTLSAVANPHISGTFSVKKASLELLDHPPGFEQISLKGTFSNGRRNTLTDATLSIPDGRCITNGRSLTLSGTLRNFLRPEYVVSIKGQTELALVSGLFPALPFRFSAGDADFDLKLEGRQGLWVDPSRTSGKIAFEKASGQWNRWTFDTLTCTMDMGNNWAFRGISGSVSNTAVTGFVNIPNPLTFFDRTAGLPVIYIDAHSPHLNLANFASKDQADEPFTLPDSIAFYGKIRLDHFQSDDFTTDSLATAFEYRPKLLVLHDFVTKTLKGTVEGGGAFSAVGNELFNLQIGARLSDIDITELFKSFENFGQAFIGYQHLSGSLSGEMQFSGHFTPQLKVVPATIVTASDVTITNGRLRSFEPMLSLSKYISVDELKDIRFSTLRNQISIRDEIINIPLMDIRSSAFNISASGTHTFANRFDYRLQVFLADFLWKKRKKPKVVEENGYVTDDGLGRTKLYLRLAGSPDKYEVTLDRERSRDALHESLQKQGEEIRRLFRNETVTKKEDRQTTEGENQHLFRWEEAETTKSGEDKPETSPVKPAPKDTLKNSDKLQFEWGE